MQGFGTLLSNLGALRGMPPAPIDTFKAVGSPVSRLYNWNLLGPVLKPFGIELSNDTKALVVAGGARWVRIMVPFLIFVKSCRVHPSAFF